MVGIAWFADWGRAPERRAVLVIGGLGALLSLAINVGIGHFYLRPRPFLALPDFHLLLPRKDGLHNWWVLDPLIGSDSGDVLDRQLPPEAPRAAD